MLKKHYLLFFAIIGILTVIINSCKKDGHSNQKAIITDQAVAQAKIWYERNYPANGSKQSTQSTTTGFDFSQRIKPDWLHALSYNKLNNQVIELPIDSPATTDFALKNNKTGQLFSSKENSKASFVLIKKGESYEAYLMIVMADSAYVKNNRSKLTGNTYLKLDTGFTGLVLYISPEGKYLSDSSYSNNKGVKVQTTTPCTPGPTPPLPTKTNPVTTKTQKVSKTQTTTASQTCIDWYLNTYINGQLVNSQYQYTTCSPTCGGNGGGGGGAGLTPGPPPTTPIFGINNSNAVVPDANFDNLLNYVESIGLSFSNPYNTTLTVNGVNYTGQITDIYQPDGTTIHYFSPDSNGGPFQSGMEYVIGEGSPTATSVTTTTPIVYLGVNFGTPSTYLGNGPVKYVPPGGTYGGGGTPLTPAQRRSLDAADDTRVLNLLKQEDDLDDAAISPCHGTARSGNVKWPGTAEHWLIQFDYIANNPGALREYVIPGSSGKLNGNPGYADIVNAVTGEMFEIKPIGPTGQSAGAAEIQLYVIQGNLLCPRVVGGGWSAGTNYTTRYLPDPRNPLNLLEAKLSSAGVIVYDSQPRNGLPQVVPVPVELPENLAEKLKKLLKQIAGSPSTMEQQILTFLRENPKMVPYLKSAAAAIIVATIVEDIATEGVGIAYDWESFVVARNLWRIANKIALH